MGFKCPAIIWAQINAIAFNFGLCKSQNTAIEFLLVSVFVLTVMAIDLLVFTPFEYIAIFNIRKPRGFSKATIKSFLISRCNPLLVALVMYIPVILFFIKVISWQRENLIMAIVIGTGIVKTFILFFWPIVIKPIFSKKIPFPDDKENHLLLEEIIQMAE